MRILLVIAILWCYQNAFSKTSAIIEDQKTIYHVRSRGSFAISEYSRIKILDENGYDYAVFHDYYDKFRRITSVKLTIIDAAGNRVKRLNRGDALDVMFNDSYELGDSRRLILDPKYRNFPFTVELEVEIDYATFLDFPLWVPRAGNDVEVKSAQLILEHYYGFEFRSEQINGIGEPTVGFDKNVKTLTWTVTNLPAIPETLNARLFFDEQPQVKVTPIEFNLDNQWGSFRTWASFGEWFLRLNNGRDKISPETIKVLNELKSSAGSQHELVRSVYEYMQKKTRYISIQLGIGGFQSIPADEVERLGYGDCKALTNYMMAMLKQLDIKSNYVLVQAGGNARDVSFGTPSNQFNHVFLAVPMGKDTIWLECTSQQSPASYLGTFTDDRHVLWVDENKSKIIRTPAYKADENKRLTSAIANFDEAGDAKITLDVKETGAFYNNIMAYQHLTKSRQEAYNYSKFNYKDFTITRFDFTTPAPGEPLLQLSYEMNVQGLAKSVGGKLLVPANLVASIENEITYDVQNKKTEVRRAFTIEDNVIVSVPENYWADGIPLPVSEKSQFGTLDITITAHQTNQFRISRKLVVKKGLYRGEQFDKFYEFVRKLKSQEQTKIVLQSKT